MTLQWTLIAVFLYIEIAFLLLLMLPWIRPPTWQKIFKSRLLKAIEAYSHIYWYSFGGILVLLFFDAIREVRKYGTSEMSLEDKFATPNADMMIHMRLFRAQRNLYIAGFAVFLYLVCRRMVQMISREAQLMASAEAAMKQAQGASTAAQSLLKDATKKKSGDKDDDTESAEFKELKKNFDALKKELSKAESDRDAMKEQSEGVKREYDRLLKEMDKIQEADGKSSKDD